MRKIRFVRRAVPIVERTKALGKDSCCTAYN